ncbi:MAG TPA: hypothetical protein DHV28_13630 [Ignavibacteriales bacterium]|nr:hypothetical protein [Ignavibacteriales bacterium]
MSYSSLVIAWTATVFLLMEDKERQIRVLYNRGFELKRIVVKAGEELDRAKELCDQKQITQNELLRVHHKKLEAERAFNNFIYNVLPGEEKIILLEINGLIRRLNDMLKKSEKLNKKLKQQKKITKQERPAQ